VDSLLLAGLNNAAWAAALALAVAIIGKVWHRRPALIHALWLLVLVKLLTPSLVQIEAGRGRELASRGGELASGGRELASGGREPPVLA
jgi:hypothetical protein